MRRGFVADDRGNPAEAAAAASSRCTCAWGTLDCLHLCVLAPHYVVQAGGRQGRQVAV